MADLESQLRPARPEEWRAWRGAMSAAFGEELAGPYLDEPSPVAELDRSLGLWEGDRIVATSGIYTPGAHGAGRRRPLRGHHLGDGGADPPSPRRS